LSSFALYNWGLTNCFIKETFLILIDLEQYESPVGKTGRYFLFVILMFDSHLSPSGPTVLSLSNGAFIVVL